MLFDPALTPDIILLENSTKSRDDWLGHPIDIKSGVISTSTKKTEIVAGSED